MREPRRPRRRRDHLHADAERARRDRVRLHRHAPRRDALSDRHRHRVRPARPGLDPRSTRPTDVAVDDVTSSYACLGLWGPNARDDPAAADDHAARLPATCARGELSVGPRAVPGAARHVRRRARLGALLPDRVRPGAVGHDLGVGPRARPGRRRLQGDRLAAPREGLSRLGRRHHARRHARTRRGSASPFEPAKGEFLGREALLARPEPGAPAALPRPRRPAARRARLGAGPHRRPRRRPGHERRLRLHRRALDRLRLPPGRELRAGRSGRGRDLRRADRRRGRRRSRSTTRRATASAV